MSPFSPSALGGNLGAFTCSIYRIDPIVGLPLEPLPDIVPGITPLRVTLDMIDGESASWDYDTTEHPVQGMIDVTANTHKQLERITVTGTLNSAPPQLPGLLDFILDPPAPGALVRLDLMRLANLKAISDSRMPVMVVTPRFSLAKAIITSVQPQGAPSDGESTMVTLQFKEARLVSPLTGDLISPDFSSQVPGNNSKTTGGQTATTPMNDETVQMSEVGGAPPDVVSGA